MKRRKQLFRYRFYNKELGERIVDKAFYSMDEAEDYFVGLLISSGQLQFDYIPQEDGSAVYVFHNGTKVIIQKADLAP